MENESINNLAQKLKLSPQEEIFANYYIESGNIADSYKRAGYKVKNVTTASACGIRMLKREKVRAYIAQRQEWLSKTAGITQLMILDEMKSVAFSKIDKYIQFAGKDGQLIDSSKIDKRDMAAVQKVVIQKGKISKVEIGLYDKERALERLYDFLGFKKGKEDDDDEPEFIIE